MGTTQNPSFALPSLPISRAECHPRGPYSVLGSSAVSSVGCQRLRTWYQGLPLVQTPTVSQRPIQGFVESVQQSSRIILPKAPELWWDRGTLSHSPLPTHPWPWPHSQVSPHNPVCPSRGKPTPASALLPSPFPLPNPVLPANPLLSTQPLAQPVIHAYVSSSQPPLIHTHYPLLPIHCSSHPLSIHPLIP